MARCIVKEPHGIKVHAKKEKSKQINYFFENNFDALGKVRNMSNLVKLSTPSKAQTLLISLGPQSIKQQKLKMVFK